jgi:Helicase conserved C-terminal domain
LRKENTRIVSRSSCFGAGILSVVVDHDTQNTGEINILELTYNIVFTSPEIVNGTSFREDVTNAPRFREKLCCVAIDEAHLIDEWKDFRNEYARIGWFRQALPRHIPLFAASATLGPIVRERVRRSCNFRENYCLIEISIDREEIFIGVYTMDRTRNSFLDLSGILPEVAVTGKEIPKTVIFVDSITEIQALRRTILNWMRRLNYPARKCQRWVKTYFASMAKASKASIAADFGTLNEAKEGLVSSSCRILIATTAYGLGIDNPDIEEVILWGLPHSMSDALQRLGRAMRNGIGQGVGRIFIPKWCVGPRTADSMSKSSLSQSQSADDPDNDEDGDLSDGVSVVDDRDAYIVEADTGGKIKLTARARRDRMKAALHRLANNPCDECIRAMMLQEMGDTTYPSKEKPKLCCSACQPDEYKLEVNEALLPVKIPRNNVHLFFAESRLIEWRAAQIASEPEDSIYSLVPATFMPDEVIKALTLRWKLIKEAPLLESLEYVRQGCQCWAECEEYATAIQTFMRGEMRSTWDTTYWHNEYSKRRWSDKKPKHIQKSKAEVKREEERDERRSLLASKKQPKTKPKTGKTAVERLSGRPSGRQSISNDDNTRREKMIRKTHEAEQLRDMSGQFTSQANRPAVTMTLSPRKDILKRAKSPPPPASTRIPMAGRSTTTIRAPASMSPMTPDDTHPPSPPLVHGTSRAGRVQFPSQKKAYDNS